MTESTGLDFQAMLDKAFDGLAEGRSSLQPELAVVETGTITQISAGIAVVKGLPNAGYDELLLFPGDAYGLAINLDQTEIGVILLSDYSHLKAGDEVKRTSRVMDVPVGDILLGRVINPMGQALDGKGAIVTTGRLPIERPSPPIMDRAAVNVPLETGIKVIDALVPIGRGQRELILGDRQSGKTTIAIDTILNQHDTGIICVYCAIGQRSASVAGVIATLEKHDAMAYTVVVTAEGSSAPGLLYIAPYAATSIAEYFMEQGKDVLIIYDDLTHHARAYRELSLLLRRPPGREAFPGDIFYVHSHLLERSTHLSPKLKGGSLTALPIIETEAQNIAAYIPTNLISITDGQIYLSPEQFDLGILPAVDVSKSVSRVGGKAQYGAYRSVTGSLKLAYAQFEELETFARFGARLDDSTKATLKHGQAIREYLVQPASDAYSVTEQLTLLLVLTDGMFDELPQDKIKAAMQAVRKAAGDLPPALIETFKNADKLSDSDRNAVIEAMKPVLASYSESIAPADAGH